METLIIMVLVALFFIGIWHIDLALTMSQGSRGMKIMATNGFGYFDIVQVYHVALYLVIAAFSLMTYLLLKNKKRAVVK